MKPVHILLVDPIAYGGGSKIASARILAMLDPAQCRISVVSRDAKSWKNVASATTKLVEPAWLAGREQGIGYFLRHLLITITLLYARLRHGRFDLALGASGPGIDLSLYIARPLMGYRIIQLIHGPVAASRTLARALQRADRVFYLDSARKSLLQALARLPCTDNPEALLADPRFSCFDNGLPEDSWPSPVSPGSNGLFWASSLLRWKGLETLVAALELIAPTERPPVQICYIRPRATGLPIGPGPRPLEAVHWHESPPDLDAIRASCNLFVSTSRNEPFGLSILESMAAGLAVLIPRDGAFWDQRLEDGVNCLKYRPDNPQDLALKLQHLKTNPEFASGLGRAAKQLARDYRASQTYRDIVDCLADRRSRESIEGKYREAEHAEV